MLLYTYTYYIYVCTINCKELATKLDMLPQRVGVKVLAARISGFIILCIFIIILQSGKQNSLNIHILFSYSFIHMHFNSPHASIQRYHQRPWKIAKQGSVITEAWRLWGNRSHPVPSALLNDFPRTVIRSLWPSLWWSDRTFNSPCVCCARVSYVTPRFAFRVEIPPEMSDPSGTLSEDLGLDQELIRPAESGELTVDTKLEETSFPW